MTTQEGEDIDKPFIETEWIQRGRIYNKTTIPIFVFLARSKVTEIRQHISSTQLSKTNISISDFLSCELPRVSSELISSKTSLWFNPEPPNIPMDSTVLRRSVPSPDFLKELEDAFS
jgi:hypothetical protein